jgi:nucleolar GTP-binding protein
MAMQSVPKIEKYQFYIDKAIHNTDKYISGLRSSSKFKGKNKVEKIEKKRIENLAKIMTNDLLAIEKAFPTFDNLSIFYQELIDIVIGYVILKKSLSSLRWLRTKINEIAKMTKKNVNKDSKKVFMGRVSSMYKKVSKDFKFLEEARKKMRNFPSIKTNIKTVCIAGYPNVGKTTLLTKLTTANPEINSYPFTTKSLMVGYIGKKIQLIDTPGTFKNDKMNYIEKQAYLALKYLAEDIVFVFDLSESCGYSVKEQEELFKNINKKFNDKNILVYLSKKDLIDENILEKFKRKYKKYNVVDDAKILKLFLKKSS